MSGLSWLLLLMDEFLHRISLACVVDVNGNSQIAIPLTHVRTPRLLDSEPRWPFTMRSRNLFAVPYDTLLAQDTALSRYQRSVESHHFEGHIEVLRVFPPPVRV